MSAKIIAFLAFGFIFSLATVIISGRILYEINNSSCYKSSPDSHIKDAHKWAAWVVALSSVMTALFLIALIGIFFI